jgi:hypothetical protein
MVVFAIIAGVYGVEAAKTPKMICGAVNGECPYHVNDTSSGACCRWHCCSEDTHPVSGQCRLINKTSDVRCGCVTHASKNKNKASSTRCDKEVKIEGETEINEDWASSAAAADIFLATAGLCFVGGVFLSIFKTCLMTRKMLPHFAAWRDKGLDVTYFVGCMDSRARIMIHLPVAPTRLADNKGHTVIVIGHAVTGQAVALAQQGAVIGQAVGLAVTRDLESQSQQGHLPTLLEVNTEKEGAMIDEADSKAVVVQVC